MDITSTVRWRSPVRRRRLEHRLERTPLRKRQRLADQLDRLVEQAELPQAYRGSAAPLNRAEIRRCHHLVHSLAAELREDQPLTPAGVLLVRRLLSDGASPLYAREDEGLLELELRRARTALLLL